MIRFIGFWHRNIGFIIALFALLLAITGVLIQHADFFKLSKTFVSNKYILNWYGIKPNPIFSYRVTDNWISHSGQFIYINDSAIEGRYNDINGAVEHNNNIFIIADKELLLITESGELIEKFSSENNLPEPLLGIASQDNEIIARGISTYWLPDEDLLNWQAYKGQHPVWTKQSPTPVSLINSIQTHNISNEITIERLLLDIHSGRFLGTLGVIIMDIAAIGILILAFTGLLLWTRTTKTSK